MGFCWTWLEDGECSTLGSFCNFKHGYPPEWTKAQRQAHGEKARSVQQMIHDENAESALYAEFMCSNCDEPKDACDCKECCMCSKFFGSPASYGREVEMCPGCEDCCTDCCMDCGQCSKCKEYTAKGELKDYEGSDGEGSDDEESLCPACMEKAVAEEVQRRQDKKPRAACEKCGKPEDVCGCERCKYCRYLFGEDDTTTLLGVQPRVQRCEGEGGCCKECWQAGCV